MRSLDMVYSHIFESIAGFIALDLWVMFLVDVFISALTVICISIISFKVLMKIRRGDVEFVVS